MKEGNILQALPEYVLRFHPPLIIQNVLPYEIIITLWDSATTKLEVDLPKIPVAVGASVEIYRFSMARKIRMAVSMAVEGRQVIPAVVLAAVPVLMHACIRACWPSISAVHISTSFCALNERMHIGTGFCAVNQKVYGSLQ